VRPAIVVLDENNLSYGGAVAAPVFSEIMQFALQQYGVSPTDLSNAQYAAAQATAEHAGNSCVVPHGAALAASEASHVSAAARQSGPTSGGTGGTAGAGTTADSLPADPTAHT
jgi:hypothetical protein